jgi:leader peptidase (prepilin peptidase)/N-methyltransferase
MTASGIILIILSFGMGRVILQRVKRLPRSLAADHPLLIDPARLETGFVVTPAAVMIALMSQALMPGIGAWVAAGLGWWLLTLSLLDLRQFWLPDALTLPLIAVGLAVTWLTAPDQLWVHTLGAVIGWGGFLAIATLFRLLRGREGLGQGDAKLLGAAGAWVGIAGLPGTILIGSALALGASLLTRREAIPFGTFLAIGLWFTWLFGSLSF